MYCTTYVDMCQALGHSMFWFVGGCNVVFAVSEILPSKNTVSALCCYLMIVLIENTVQSEFWCTHCIHKLCGDNLILKNLNPQKLSLLAKRVWLAYRSLHRKYK